MQPNNTMEVVAMDLDSIFEEYVDSDMLRPFSNSVSDRSGSDKLACHFEFASSDENDCFPIEYRSSLDQTTAWHKAVQDCDQSLSSSQSDCSSSHTFHDSTPGEESYSDSELSRFQEVTESEKEHSQSISQPCTPPPYICDRPFKKAASFRDHRQQLSIKRSLKKSLTKASVKMMQFDSDSSASNIWRCQPTPSIESLIRTPADKTSSHSTSPRIIQQDHNDIPLVEQYGEVHNLDLFPMPVKDDNCFSHHNSTSSVTSEIGTINEKGYNDNIDLAFDSCSMSSVALSALLTPPSSLPITTETWIPDTPPASGFKLTASPEFLDSTDSCSWWSSDITTTQSSYYPMEDSLQFTGQNPEVQGLGITCKNSPFDFDTALILPTPSSASASFNTTPYSATYPPLPHHQPLASAGHTFSRTPSPNNQPCSHRRKLSSRSRPRHRASHSQRCRSSSSSQHSSSRQASNASTTDVGFVNFTPEDSRKILTGVAPSGSSKTKARREREAAERRRKLSQAALKAVMDAGGDVDSIRHLERDGLLVL